jgi:hypothetical protein
MEYGDAITARASSQAFELARAKVGVGTTDLRSIAAEAVAEAYCVCVVEGEDAVEGHISAVHANLIDEIEARLRKWVEEKE